MELQLFSEEEMRSGSRSTDYFDLFEDAYLEAMRLKCSLDDLEPSGIGTCLIDVCAAY